MTTTTLDLAPVLRSSLGRRLAAVRDQARTRSAHRSELARQIVAYPATRSASPVVLPVVPR